MKNGSPVTLAELVVEHGLEILVLPDQGAGPRAAVHFMVSRRNGHKWEEHWVLFNPDKAKDMARIEIAKLRPNDRVYPYRAKELPFTT